MNKTRKPDSCYIRVESRPPNVDRLASRTDVKFTFRLVAGERDCDNPFVRSIQPNCSKIVQPSRSTTIRTRGGVKDKRLEAKDTKKFRGQGQTLSRPRTKDTDASVLKKKDLQKLFQAISKKVFKIFFFR